MIKVEPLIKADDYLAFRAMMPKEPAFKDAPTGIYIDFATFSTREDIRIQSGSRPNTTIVMVRVHPDKFEQYCENYAKDRNWQSLTNFADAKFDMVRVQPDKFEQYCGNYDKDRNWQSLTNFADAKFDMGLDMVDDDD